MLSGVIAGEHRIDRVVGVGGRGVVFSAEHPRLGERVAIKLDPLDVEGGNLFQGRK